MADQSTDDLVNQLLAQTTVAPQPSFMGLQAPPDPGQLQTLLSKLRQQQFLQQQSVPTPGQYGFLHDAGKAQFSQAGQILGNLLQQPGGLSGALRRQPAPAAKRNSAGTTTERIGARWLHGRDLCLAASNRPNASSCYRCCADEGTASLCSDDK